MFSSIYVLKGESGQRFKENRIYRDCQTFSLEKASKTAREKITLDALRAAEKSLMPFLKLTGEVAEGSRNIPCLDTTAWFGKLEYDGPIFVGKGAPEEGWEEVKTGIGIRYRFYKKPMTSQITC